MAEEGMVSSPAASVVVEDVVRQNGTRLSDIDLASRKAEEASLRRYEAAEWLRKMVGVVGSRDLPAEPSEEDFRLGLRSGIILCTAINKVQPGTIPKVVEAPNDTVVVADGAALMAYQYFENVRNFLVAVEEMGLPTFEASDLEQGGKTARVVNCVLALKSFSDWKVAGGSGSWKLTGGVKSPSSGKTFLKKNTDRYLSAVSRVPSGKELSLDPFGHEQFSDLGLDLSDIWNSSSVSNMIRSLITDKKPEEIPSIVESALSKILEDYERRLAHQIEALKNTSETMSISGQNTTPTESPKAESQSVGNTAPDEASEAEQASEGEEEVKSQDYMACEPSNSHLKQQEMIVERQKRDIRALKRTICTIKDSMQLLQMKYHEEFNFLGKQLQSLTHAASGYKKVLEENRKLYNLVQDLKGNIRVYCRIRPFLPGQASGSTTVDHIEEGNITILTPSKNGKEAKKAFTFNKVFGPAATQAEVYGDMQPLVRSVLDGYNVCIFAYGQTGAGKTYTMTGPNNLTEETYGVNYRALNDLFCITQQRKETTSYEVSVQMMEIYNEQVRDLLATDGSNKRLEIRNSSLNGINVPDANRLAVSTTSDVINLMNLGHKNRAVSSTAMNDRSSRSHSCMTVHVEGKDLTSGAILRGCMHLVDLAGSERVDKSEVTGDRLKEAQHINKSLAALGDVIASLASKSAHVPYRNSKLTQLLQDSLGGQAKTLMFVHISPEVDAVGETISTLKFAERVSTVELGAAKANKDTGDVKELKEQIANLKAALSRKEEEVEHLSRSLTGTPESLSVKSATSTTSSPVHPALRAPKDTSSARRSSTEDVANIKAKATTTVTRKERRRSLDPKDLLPNDHWSGLKGEENGQGEWMEKVMKQDLVGRPRSSGHDTLKQSLHSMVANNRDNVQVSRYDPAHPDVIDELETAASDTSEPDIHHFHPAPKVSSMSNGLSGSRSRKPLVKTSQNMEKKSMIPAAPLRKVTNGTSPHISRNGVPAGHMKRRTGNTNTK